MRWVQFVILAYLVLVVQSTLCGMIAFDVGAVGRVMPDLMAVTAVFVALRGPNLRTVMIAAWVLGFAVDLTAIGGVGSATAVGPMSLAYAVAAWLIFQMREAVFSDHAITQGMLALVFCLAAHLLWVTAQSLLRGAWPYYGRLVAQAAGKSIYTALLMPAGFWLLSTVQGLFIEAPVRGTRRSRRAGR